MGIVVDMSRSNVTFKDPLVLHDPMDVVHNQIVYDMHSFAIKFGVSFDPDPKTGYGGTPPDPDLFRIGIIQNVLYEMLYFEYEGHRKFKEEFSLAAIDSVSGTFALPFYAEPVFGPTRRNERPYTDIWYTPQGYGELLNPNNASGVATNNKPDSVDIWDQPGGGATLRLNGSMISRIEKVLSFQTWLVVKKENKFEALAHIPPFSLVFWFYTTPAKTAKPTYSFETPPYKYGCYGLNGMFGKRKIDYSKTSIGDSPSVQPMMGIGGRFPMTSGPTALDRATKFLKANGLSI